MSRVHDNWCVIFAIDLGSVYYSPKMLRPPVKEVVDFNLGALNGSLSVCLHYCQEHRVDVWVMKEYGVQESWTKLFSTDVCEIMKPLAYSNTENEVILEGGPFKLLRYDLEKKRMHRLQVPDCGWLNESEAGFLVETTFEAHDFVESLVKPMTMARRDARTTGKATNRRNVNKRHGFLSKGFKLVL